MRWRRTEVPCVRQAPCVLGGSDRAWLWTITATCGSKAVLRTSEARKSQFSICHCRNFSLTFYLALALSGTHARMNKHTHTYTQTRTHTHWSMRQLIPDSVEVERVGKQRYGTTRSKSNRTGGATELSTSRRRPGTELSLTHTHTHTGF